MARRTKERRHEQFMAALRESSSPAAGKRTTSLLLSFKVLLPASERRRTFLYQLSGRPTLKKIPAQWKTNLAAAIEEHSPANFVADHRPVLMGNPEDLFSAAHSSIDVA
jgi:hypothetical protein